MSPSASIRSATRPIRPALIETILALKPGQHIRLVQAVRVGSSASWSTTVEGVYRGYNYLATGIATDRVPADDIVVVTIHFTKKNGEMSSITLDDKSQIEVITAWPT